MYDFEVIRIEDKTLAKAVTELRDNYERAKTLSYVNDPLAWALYQTWKTFDREYNVELKEAERWKEIGS